MKTYKIENELTLISETNDNQVDVLYFYKHIKDNLNQDRLSDGRILDLFKLMQMGYFDNVADLVSCLDEFNNHIITDLETIDLEKFAEFAENWTPYTKVVLNVCD